MRVEVIQSIEQAEVIRRSWADLFTASGAPLLYSDPDFCLNWYQQFVENPRFVPWYREDRPQHSSGRMELVLGWSGDRLDVALPLVRVPLKYRGLSLSSVQCLINGQSDVSNLLLRKGLSPEASALLLRTLLEGETWHVLNLGQLPRTPEINALMTASEAYSVPLPIEDGARKFRLRYGGTFSQHLGRHSALRQHVKYRRRRLEREFGAYDLEHWTGADAAKFGFETFLEVDGASWKRAHPQGESLAADSTLRNYYSGLCSRLSTLGRCHVWILRIAGEPAAAALCFEAADVLYGYKTSYDERFAAGSPGFVLISSIIESTARPRCRSLISRRSTKAQVAGRTAT